MVVIVSFFLFSSAFSVPDDRVKKQMIRVYRQGIGLLWPSSSLVLIRL